MARLPKPGADNGVWGDILNEYLSQSLASDGLLKDDSVGSAQLQDNAVTANVLAPNSVSNSAIARNAVNATSIADGSITEALLDSQVQTKINQAPPTWATLAGRPAVVGAGTDQLAARAAIGAADADALLLSLAASPDLIATGVITRSGAGAAIGFSASWPDGATGTFTGTESTGFPGAIDSYTVTHVLAGVTTTYTQPALTRNGTGAVTNRPALVVS
ncbi:hypothetical protein [Mycobacteroides abscessus]|nr:hypothetical protein [Mycobacteroides abscessus]SKT87659.1 Uncharacterised protein [Mycobacteroides abscessus subsp. massiliense]SKU07742.1 Uncharacterised protein [Mycobacteroides abscessus subsp. massiliense]